MQKADAEFIYSSWRNIFTWERCSKVSSDVQAIEGFNNDCNFRYFVICQPEDVRAALQQDSSLSNNSNRRIITIAMNGGMP